ncbi:hypothetical protein MOSE0_J09780 [Monosporozyma servazzii]
MTLQRVTLVLLFLFAFVKSQALYYQIGETSSAAIGKQNINPPNDTDMPSHSLPFDKYIEKKNTVDYINYNSRLVQNGAPGNETNGSDTTKIEYIVSLNATDYHNTTIENWDNVEGEMRGKKDSDGKTDEFWYPKYCKSKRCKIIVSIATYLYDIMDLINGFISKLIQTTLYIVYDTKKYKRTGDCGSGVLWETNRDGDEWQVAISIFTGGKDCDTAASEKEIKRALECAVSDKEFQNKLAFCVIMDAGGTWHADVRFQRGLNMPYDNIWTIECRSDNGKHYAYENGCTEDHISDEL